MAIRSAMDQLKMEQVEVQIAKILQLHEALHQRMVTHMHTYTHTHRHAHIHTDTNICTHR
jgi:hypothetical protein